MIPILYPKNETAFTSNGIGRLAGCISFTVTEERNGIFEAEFVYPITGKHYAEIEEGMIVSALHDDSRTPQPFEIYRRTAPIDGLVTFYAHHISYKAGNVIINPPVTAQTCAEALTALSESTVNTNPFTLWTDKASQGTFSLGYPISLKQILGGVQGSILDAFGGGEYEWDKWTIRLYQRRGTDTDVEIRYGKNLRDIEKDLDVSGCYNAVVPYCYNDESGTLVMLPEKVLKADPAFAVEYPWTNEAAVHIQTENAVDIEFAVLQAVPDSDLITVPMDLSDAFEAEPTAEELRSAATSRLEASEAWVPDQNIKVDFVALWQTEEYAQLAPLQRVKLCDTLRVIYTALGVDVRMKVIKTVYNCLLERYDEIELGKAKTSFAEVVRAATMEELIKQVPTKTYLQTAIDQMTQEITGGAGGSFRIVYDADGKPVEVLYLDTDDVATAVNVWRWNGAGLAHSSNGINGPYTIGITASGHIVADFVDTGTLSANLIQVGTMLADRILGGTLKLGGGSNGNGVLEIYDANGTLIGTLDNTGATLTGDITMQSGDILSNAGTIQYPSVDAVAGQVRYLTGTGFSVKEIVSGVLKSIWSVIPTGNNLYESSVANSLYRKTVAIIGNGLSSALAWRQEITAAGEHTDIFDFNNSKDFAKHYAYDYICLGHQQGQSSEAMSTSPTYAMLCANRAGIFMTSANGHWLRISTNYRQIDGQTIQVGSTSSRRYKHDIKPISGDRDPARLLNLPVVEFLYNDNHPLQYADMEGQTLPGLIAEDVAEIYPSAAIRDADGNVESWDERRIIPGMLALIQEQQRRIDKLEAQLAQLLDRLEG